MKDSPISKLIITETRHRPTQYKKVIDTLPVLCADKNYQGLDDIIWNGINLLVEADFTPQYSGMVYHSPCGNCSLQPNQPTRGSYWWTSSHHHNNTERHVFDANLQQELLSEFKWNSKIKSQEFSKFLANKKALIAIISGQCDKATKTEITLEKICSGPPCREAYQVPQPIMHRLFWKQQRQLIIQVLQASCSSEVDEQLQ